jgi:ubiquinone/menaquinone biosynthesis C-methylase UbiE
MVTNTYLFHELPYTAQRNTVREFARVLKPGVRRCRLRVFRECLGGV